MSNLHGTMFAHIRHPEALVYFAVFYLAMRAFIRGFFEVRRTLRARSDRRAANWLVAAAIVQSSYEVFDRKRREKEEWATVLQYVYDVNGDFYSGTYLLPGIRSKSYLAEDRGREWLEKTISVRYNPANPAESTFLIQDGAPGKPYVPRTLTATSNMTAASDMTLLHLK